MINQYLIALYMVLGKHKNIILPTVCKIPKPQKNN